MIVNLRLWHSVGMSVPVLVMYVLLGATSFELHPLRRNREDYIYIIQN